MDRINATDDLLLNDDFLLDLLNDPSTTTITASLSLPNLTLPKTSPGRKNSALLTPTQTPTAPHTEKKKTKQSKPRCYKKRRTEGLEGFLASGPTIDEAIAAGLIPPLPVGETKEIRKERRLIRNRVSAQLHRERKKLYVENLERRVQDQADELLHLRAGMQRLVQENNRLRGVSGSCVSGSDSTISPSSSASCASATSSYASSSYASSSSAFSSSASSSSASNPSFSAPSFSATSSTLHSSMDVPHEATHSGSDTDMDISPSASVERQPPVSQKEEGGATPEQLQAYADDLGLQEFDLAEFDPEGGYAAAAATDFQGFSTSTNGLLQLDLTRDTTHQHGAMLNAPLLPTPTASFTVEPTNPKKRAFFMMDMFFFVALFGGAGIFGAHHQDTSLFPMQSLAAPPAAGSVHRAMISGRSGGRRLLSIENEVPDIRVSSDVGNDENDENDKDATTTATAANADLKAVALWQDLTYIHTNTNESGMTCDIDDLLGNVVNASSLAQGTLMQPPTHQDRKKSIRGGVAKKVMVPYYNPTTTLASGQYQPFQPRTTAATQNAFASALALQQQMAYHHAKSDSSTILCPKPYGMLSGGGEQWKGDGGARVVLLLPSSSVSKTNGNSADSWDGSWVEVDAKITAIRKIPLYQSNGLSSGSAHHRAIPL